jgi:NAD+ synthetase
MKIMMGQINTTPCDFNGNVAKIKRGVLKAGAEGCDLAVFPEMSIPGYLCQDLMYNQDFLKKNLEGLAEIQHISASYPDLHIVVGCVFKNTSGTGKPFRNSAVVIKDGYTVATYDKQLLPFYDVFDEGRYFEPGKQSTVFKIGDRTVGLTICEDIWNDKEAESHYYYTNPVEKYLSLDVDMLINLSSSPYAQGKLGVRSDMIDRIAEKFPCGMIYVNQVGGQDELVFDGRSTINGGHSLYGSNAFYLEYNGDSSNSTYPIIDEYKDRRQSCWRRVFEQPQHLKEMLVMGLRDYLNKSGFKQVVLGSSGGIDSALVAALACEAIGPENVHCIMMPSVHSSNHSVADAEQLHKNLGCHEYKVPVEHQPVVDKLVSEFGEFVESSDEGNRKGYNPVADENIQSRIRGNYVMWFSNAIGALALTTGNKTELAIGYATLYGDMNGGYAPISDLYKMQVYDIAKQFYGDVIPENIITKEPSAELAEGQFDQNELLPYPLLDSIVKSYVESNVHDHAFYTDNDEVSEEEYNKIIRRIDNNEFKRRQYAPGTKLSSIAFGIGRRIPIVKGSK